QSDPSWTIPGPGGSTKAGVIVPDGVTIYGDGRASVIHSPGGDPSPNICSTLVLTGSFIELRGLCFRGDNGSSDGVGFVAGSGYGPAISPIGVGKHDITVTGCWFEKLFGFSIQNNGVPATSGHSRCKISGNTMRWNAKGLNFSTWLSEYVGNDLYSSGQIELLGYQCTISGNRMSGAYNGGIAV